MFTKMPAFLSGLFEVFRVEPAVATVEARLMFHSLDEEQRSGRWCRGSACTRPHEAADGPS